jgi:hypothetical protein
MSSMTVACRWVIAHPLMHASNGKRCPFHSGLIASSSA